MCSWVIKLWNWCFKLILVLFWSILSVGNVSKCFWVVLDQKWGFGVKNGSKPSQNCSFWVSGRAMLAWRARSGLARIADWCSWPGEPNLAWPNAQFQQLPFLSVLMFWVVSGHSNLFLLHCFDVLKPFKLEEQLWDGLNFVLGWNWIDFGKW